MPKKPCRTARPNLDEALQLGQAGGWAIGPANGEFVHVTAELLRSWSVDPHAGGESIDELRQRVHPDDRDRYASAIERSIDGKDDVEMEYRVVLPDGTIKLIHTVAHPVFDTSGDLIEIVGTSLDITERKRAEDALREAQVNLARVNRVATLGTLVASLTHEVTQPLAAMVTSAAACSRWLAAQPPRLDRAQQALDRIIRDGKRASAVVARVRALIRHQPPSKDLVDINEAILEVLPLVRFETQRNGVVLRAELADGLPRVLGDRVQLQQVILNLIVNGIESVSGVEGRPRQVVIASEEGDFNRVLIVVRDLGRGLDPMGAHHLFEPFYTTKSDGMGMGLTISRSIVEAHGGSLSAVPNFPHGAVFQVSLPIGHRHRFLRRHSVEPRSYDDAG